MDNKEMYKVYNVLYDSYRVRYNLRYRAMNCILKHMIRHIGVDSTIYSLMELVRKNNKYQK